MAMKVCVAGFGPLWPEAKMNHAKITSLMDSSAPRKISKAKRQSAAIRLVQLGNRRATARMPFKTAKYGRKMSRGVWFKHTLPQDLG